MQPSNLLHIETLSDGWCDKDVVMLYACFQLLTDCIEKENLLTGNGSWNQNDEYKQARNDIEELYNWWLERQKLSTSEKFNDLNEKQYLEDNEQLIKLISVRKYLWT